MDVCDLAITSALWFETPRIYAFFFDIPGHPIDHLYNGFVSFDVDEKELGCSAEYSDMVTLLTGVHPWSAENHDICVELITHIVQCYGENPANALTSDMDNKGVRLCCKAPECYTKSTRVILTWRAAVSKRILYHPLIDALIIVWRIASPFP